MFEFLQTLTLGQIAGVVLAGGLILGGIVYVHRRFSPPTLIEKSLPELASTYAQRWQDDNDDDLKPDVRGKVRKEP
ncbi:hypothetical protein J6590_073358 [Homalodisca vitripennis]|nr:hypothetical protein J6590_073358 [Homalodisca vitripennis]